ncbi:6769_t:CDS:2 [Gigaspora margarita]|uniref:6769_t:CDS:1 n=1 Tax=Gigaspora margarita TaxID=4874 RepID=A0ABN7W9Y5_GIGMA|nr:6769_t:CDS:2 [Gigaspora margarita]
MSKSVPKRYEIANKELKSKPQGLDMTNNIQAKEKVYMYGSENKKKQWLEMFYEKTTRFKMILYKTIYYLPI